MIHGTGYIYFAILRLTGAIANSIGLQATCCSAILHIWHVRCFVCLGEVLHPVSASAGSGHVLQPTMNHLTGNSDVKISLDKVLSRFKMNWSPLIEITEITDDVQQGWQFGYVTLVTLERNKLLFKGWNFPWWCQTSHYISSEVSGINMGNSNPWLSTFLHHPFLYCSFFQHTAMGSFPKYTSISKLVCEDQPYN